MSAEDNPADDVQPTREEWRPVVGFEGLYEVSNFGRVRGVDRIIPYRFAGMTRVWKGKILRQCNDKDGYKLVRFSKNGKNKMARVHNVVLQAFVGPCPKGHEALHSPGSSRDNNRLDNLRWGTQKENAADRDSDGRTCRGNRHWARTQPERYRKVFQEAAWNRNKKGNQ